MSAPARQPRRTAGLGRGMASLIPMNDSVADTLFSRGPSATDVLRTQPIDLVPVPGAKLAAIPLDAIRPNPQQPRTVFDDEAMAELVHSVRENGVLQPIVVRPLPDPDRFELVMGERRLRASKEAGVRTIPAVVRDTDDDRMLQDALLENLHRSQLNPLEEASAYQQLMADFGITHEALGARLGRSRPTISNTLRLLKLPEHIQQKVAGGVLTAAHARAVLSVVDPELMDRLVDKIVVEELSVRQAEAAAVHLAGPTKPRQARGRRYEHLDEIADRLGSRLDTRVRVDLNAKRGRIVIDFGSVADLNRILGVLGERTWAEGEVQERMLDERAAVR